MTNTEEPSVLAKSFDRAAERRKNRDYLYELLTAPLCRVVPVWRNQSFVINEPDASGLLPHARGELIEVADEIVWLGMHGDSPCFALDLSSCDAPLTLPGMQSGQFVDLRWVLSVLAESDFQLLAYARAMLHWHRSARFCGRCGHETQAREGGHLRECQGCQHKHFPRTDPAVMILINHGSDCLLARQPGFPKGMYSTLAGFVEPGERLEETVVREAREEVGLEVEPGAYLGSQAWPFPASLMIGFRAVARGRELRIDHDELEDARWFTRAELASPDGFFIPPAASLANRLISEFLKSE